jgi:membrane protease YdiL (CAAX protease family)
MGISPAEPSADSNAANVKSQATPWGLGLTLLFATIIAVIYTFVSVVSVGVLAAVESVGKPPLHIEAQLEKFMSNGFYISVTTLTAAIVASALIVLLAKLRRGMALSDYLGLKRVPLAILSKWILGVALLLASWDLSNWFLGRPVVPPFMVQAYATAGIMPLFWLAIVIAAPVVEELFFRGFLFAGLSASRLGPRWTIAITSVAWGSTHTQYQLYDILMICALGVALGIARWKTASIYTTIILHSITNLGATVEVWLLTALGK